MGFFSFSSFGPPFPPFPPFPAPDLLAPPPAPPFAAPPLGATWGAAVAACAIAICSVLTFQTLTFGIGAVTKTFSGVLHESEATPVEVVVKGVKAGVDEGISELVVEAAEEIEVVGIEEAGSEGMLLDAEEWRDELGGWDEGVEGGGGRVVEVVGGGSKIF